MKHLYSVYRQSFLLFIFFVCGISGKINAQQIITTVAGNGSNGYSGDGGPATNASIWYPYDVAADGYGNFYIGNYWGGSGYARIRKVDPSGTINTSVGTGVPGFSGDGGPATAAQIQWGGGVACDGAGNYYVMDWGNYRIRKVNTSGIITTIAGNGSSTYSGDGGQATAAGLGTGWGGGWSNMACDPSGNLYFWTWGSGSGYRIRRIDASTGIITWFAGNSSWGYSGDGGPATAAAIDWGYGMAADGSGNVYLSSYNYRKVRVINSSGIINCFAGTGGTGFSGDGGPATAATLYPYGVAVDGAGNVTIADYSNNRVRLVNTSGIISTIAGSGTWGFSGDGGPATAAAMEGPVGLGADPSGNVYVGDYNNLRIRKIGRNRPVTFTGGHVQTLTVCANSTDSINVLLQIHDSDQYQLESYVVLAGAVNGVVYGGIFTFSNGLIVTPHNAWYRPNAGFSGLDSFSIRVSDGLTFDTTEIYVTVNPVPSTVTGSTIMTLGGFSLLSASPSGGTWSSGSSGIAVVGSGSGVVTGTGTGTAVITYTLPTGCMQMSTVNVLPNAGQSIMTIAGNGTAAFGGDGGAAIAANLNGPYGVAADGSGNFYIADALNNRIRKVTASGVISTYAGTGTPGSSGDGGPATGAKLYAPISVALDGSGNLYIADQDNHKVRKISASGVITTIAGNGTPGFGGDGSPATVAQLNYPTGLAVDAAGNVFIADQYNHRIRKVTTSGIITTVAGNGTPAFGGDGTPATAAQLSSPDGVAVDALGNMYIADFGNYRVRKVNSSGIISTITGNTSGYGGDGGPATAANLTGPYDVTVDAAGNIYISDHTNHRVRKISPSGIISTIAGTGTPGFGGDNCAATAGTLYNPAGLFADGAGRVYIADKGNNRIRRIQFNYAPYFNGGHRQTLTGCQNSPVSLNAYLGATDVDVNQGETWSAVTTPLHGTTSVSYTATSTGSMVTPTGLTYTPATGYTGLDSFKVAVTDCSGGADTTLLVITVSLPPSAISGPATVCAGFTAYYSDPVGTGVWTSSNTSIATIGSSDGLVTGISASPVTITFAPGASCMVTKSITVNPSPVAISGTPHVCIGVATTFTDATGGGSWSSSTGLASVTSGGAVTGLTVGVTTISYTQGGCWALYPVTITPMPSALSGSPYACVGGVTSLYDLTSGGTWSSSAPTVGSVDAVTGVIAGVSAGPMTITYSMGGACYVTEPMTVDPLPPAIGGPLTACIGQTSTLTDASPGGAWSAFSLGSVANIDAGYGVDTGLAAGTATIIYTLLTGGQCSISTIITVNPTPAPIGGPTTLCVGQTIALTDTGSGVWTSSSTGIATVGSSSGLVTGVFGVSGGSPATISYTDDGCTVTQPVVVSPGAGTISGAGSVCVGQTTLYTDGSGGSGTWSSSSGAASVGSTTGLVLGISAGVATISFTVTSTHCVTTRTITVNGAPAPITGSPLACIGTTDNLSDPTPGGIWTSSSPGVATISGSGAVSPLLTGTTTITYSVGGVGCVTTLVVTVNNIPSAITGPLSVCAGSSTTVSDASAPGTWTVGGSAASLGASSGGTATINGVAPGSSTITFTQTSTTCMRTAAVTVNNIPSAMSGTLSVCTGSATNLGDAPGPGVWAVSGSAATLGATSGTTAVINGVTTGTVTVSFTQLSTGCVRTGVVTVNSAPAAIGGPGSVCQGSALILTNTTPGGTWSSPSSSVLVAGTTGVVAGVSAGTAPVSYTLGSTGCAAVKTVTVNNSTITGPSALCALATFNLSGNPGGGTWSSSNPGVATIGSVTGTVTGATTGSTVISYIAPTGCAAAMTVNVSSSPTSITGSSTVCAGDNITLGNTITGGVWSSSTPAAATVGSLSGIVSGVAVGVTTITYSLGSGCTQTKSITVTASPAAIVGNTNICAGSTTLLADGTPGGVWSTSASSVAAVTGGTVTAGVTGTAVISYTAGGCSATATVTVNASPGAIGGPAAVCVGSAVTETNSLGGGVWSSSSASVSVTGSSGDVTGLIMGVAPVTYTVGGCQATRPVTVSAVPTISGASGVCVGATALLSAGSGGSWSSGSPSVASVGPASGIVTGNTTGTAVITYSLGTGCIATQTMTVNTAPTSIVGATNICSGTSGTLTGSPGGGLWSSSSPSTAAVGSTSGTLTGGTAGTATISYSLGSGCTISRPVTVRVSPAAISGGTQVCTGSAMTLSDATSGGGWSSSAAGIASVSAGGVVSGVSGGVATISYTVGGCPALQTVTVSAAISAITGPAAVCAGQTAAYSDAAGSGTWSSSAPGTALIGSSSGIVTGGLAGIATLTYTLAGGCGTTLTITVNASPLPISGGAQVCIGSTTVLGDPTPGGAWSSGGGGVSVSAGGVVTGVSAGTTDISYSVAGCPAVMTVTVNGLPPAITGSPNVCIGTTTTLGNSTTGGVWSSSNPVVAGIGSSTGFVTGYIPGNVTMTYSMGPGCAVSRLVTVNPSPAGIMGSSSVCINSTTALVDATPGGSWSSGTPLLATVSSAGIVSGLWGGPAMISYTIPATGCASVMMVSVIVVPAIQRLTDMCAWGDTLYVSDSVAAGIYSSTTVSVLNLGGGIGVVTARAPGPASLIYTLAGSGCSITQLMTINPIPVGISGGDRLCNGQTMLFTDGTSGGSWSSSSPLVASIDAASGVATGLSPGTVRIRYTLGTGCSMDTVLSVLLPPTTISGTPQACVGSTTLLSDGVTGGIWSSSNPSVAMAGPSGIISGTGAGVATISYYTAPACVAVQTVTVDAVPLAYAITGGGNYCAGDSGLHVGLVSSQTGVSYQLRAGTAAVGSALAGTGGALDLGLQTTGGLYTITASSPAGCAAMMSGVATIAVNPVVIPSVTISAVPGNTLCVGTPVSFSAGSTGGGSAPAYQWLLNGAAAGTGTSYGYTPGNGDIVRVILNSNELCARPDTAVAQTTMTVLPMLIPTVTVTTSPGTVIKPGQSETLTAVVTGAGSAPLYQWSVNSVVVAGATNAVFITNTLSDGDVVMCTVTSTGMCGNLIGMGQQAITVHDNTGVTTLQTAGDILVQPNPNRGVFTVKGTLSEVTEEQVTIELTDMLGRKVYTEQVSKSHGRLETEVHPGKLANGMYLLSLICGEDRRMFHVVIEQ